MWERESDHMVLDLLRGGGISEEELVREIWHLLDDHFERNVLRAGGEEADTQAVIDEGLGSSPERRVRETLTGRHPALAEGARERNERR